MKMLIFCYPLYKNKLHFNHTGEHLIFATDELARLLIERGHEVDVVSIAEPVPNTLMRSKLRAKTINEVDVELYDIYYHAFRYPTQPEVLKILEELNLDYHGKPVLNDAHKLVHHTKWDYIPILESRGIAPKIYPDVKYGDVNWGNASYSTR